MPERVGIEEDGWCSMNMSARTGSDLRKKWESEHPGVVCEHPAFAREYAGSANTGDKICVVCGACFRGAEADKIAAENAKGAQRLWRLLKEAERRAQEIADGHLTIMRFTTGWKVFFGTPHLMSCDSLDGMRDYVGLWLMPVFDTVEAALFHANKTNLQWRCATEEEVRKHFKMDEDY